MIEDLDKLLDKARDCPFCGGRSLEWWTALGGGVTRIECRRCATIGPQSNNGMKKALELWNGSEKIPKKFKYLYE